MVGMFGAEDPGSVFVFEKSSSVMRPEESVGEGAGSGLLADAVSTATCTLAYVALLNVNVRVFTSPCCNNATQFDMAPVSKLKPFSCAFGRDNDPPGVKVNLSSDDWASRAQSISPELNV